MIYDSMVSLFIYILGISGILSGLEQHLKNEDFLFKKLLLYYFVIVSPIYFFANNILYDFFPYVITSLGLFVLTIFVTTHVFWLHLKKIRGQKNE